MKVERYWGWLTLRPTFKAMESHTPTCRTLTNSKLGLSFTRVPFFIWPFSTSKTQSCVSVVFGWEPSECRHELHCECSAIHACDEDKWLFATVYVVWRRLEQNGHPIIMKMRTRVSPLLLRMWRAGLPRWRNVIPVWSDMSSQTSESTS